MNNIKVFNMKKRDKQNLREDFIGLVKKDLNGITKQNHELMKRMRDSNRFDCVVLQLWHIWKNT
jgi:hypothetical protein